MHDRGRGRGAEARTQGEARQSRTGPAASEQGKIGRAGRARAEPAASGQGKAGPDQRGVQGRIPEIVSFLVLTSKWSISSWALVKTRCSLFSEIMPNLMEFV